MEENNINTFNPVISNNTEVLQNQIPTEIQNQSILPSDKNNENNKKNIRFYIISGIILSLLLAICCLLIFKPKETINFFYKKDVVSKVSPLKSSISNFYSNNYKITTKGSISLKNEWSMAFALNDKIYYTENGTPFKVNGLLKTDNLFYSVNSDKKTYKSIDPIKQKNFIDLAFNKTFLLGIILNEEKLGNFSWTNIGNNEWTSDWKYITDSLPQGAKIKVKITLDPDNKLINLISLRVNNSDPWQDTSYKYEQISDISEFSTIPLGYTEEK